MGIHNSNKVEINENLSKHHPPPLTFAYHTGISSIQKKKKKPTFATSELYP
jgi:hypothetical protein